MRASSATIAVSGTLVIPFLHPGNSGWWAATRQLTTCSSIHSDLYSGILLSSLLFSPLPRDIVHGDQTAEPQVSPSLHFCLRLHGTGIRLSPLR